MVELAEIKSKNKDEIENLCNLIKVIFSECYKEILTREELDYILYFIMPSVIKDEIKEGFKYCFIKKNDKIIGFIEYSLKDNLLNILRFYILEKYRFKHNGTGVIDKLKELKPNKIQLEINQQLSNKPFIKWGFKVIKPTACYIGSDYFLYNYLMELTF